ncbi:hypothetical protein X768_22535 [Mesorhizobium sp. LSJC265A00]|nr:hypothetical protein X768_22535 [Mesorhizobium sp. LSJC265A00]
MDVRDLGQIVDPCIKKGGLGFQIFNAVNDNIVAELPTAEFLSKHAPNTPVTRTLDGFEGPISNRKLRDVLGFRHEHDWRTATRLMHRRVASSIEEARILFAQIFPGRFGVDIPDPALALRADPDAAS